MPMRSCSVPPSRRAFLAVTLALVAVAACERKDERKPTVEPGSLADRVGGPSGLAPMGEGLSTNPPDGTVPRPATHFARLRFLPVAFAEPSPGK